MQRLFGIFFAIVVIGMGIFTHTLINGSSKDCTVAVEGTVTGYQQTTDDEGSTFNHAVIQYQYNGRNYQETSSIGTGKKPYAEGEKLTVYINPDNPYEFNIDGEGNAFVIASWVMIVLGILMLLGEIWKILRYGFGAAGGNGVRDLGLISLIVYLVQNRKDKQSENLNE